MSLYRQLLGGIQNGDWDDPITFGKFMSDPGISGALSYTQMENLYNAWQKRASEMKIGGCLV